MEISGKVALVSGGASGLGEAVTRALIQAGATVVIADMNADKGEALAGELGAQAAFAKTDVADEHQVLAAIDLASGRGELRAAISCAGVASVARLVERDGTPHSLALFQKVLAVNLFGTFNVMRLAAAAMTKNAPDAGTQRGVIVNTASIAAFEGQIGQVAYSASKGAVVGMMLPAARDLAKAGIRVCTVCPGTMDTPLLAGLPEAARASLAAAIPFPNRLGRPSEFAALVKHIIENDYLNAETIRLDGALRMAPK